VVDDGEDGTEVGAADGSHGRDEVDGIDRWLAEMRVDDASRARARTSWLARQAHEEATLAGVLTDLAERDRPVVLTVRGGVRHRGAILLVGTDFCALRTPTGADVLVAFSAIASVRPQPGEAAVTGDRAPVSTSTLGEALAGLVGTGRRVRVLVNGCADSLVGELRAVGRDVVAVRLDGPAGTAYVPLASLAEVSVTESG